MVLSRGPHPISPNHCGQVHSYTSSLPQLSWSDSHLKPILVCRHRQHVSSPRNSWVCSIAISTWQEGSVQTVQNYCLAPARLLCLCVKNNIALTVTVCITLFGAISELQREKLCQSRAATLNWNGQTHGQSLQAKSWVPSSLPCHHPHRAWSVAAIF